MDLTKFFEIVLKLKGVERTGWTERGVKMPETSSDHSFMTGLMTLVLGKGRKLDLDKAVRMALVHDLPEAILGDIITKENWEKGGSMREKDKIQKERPAMKKISSLAGDPEILELWEEFEAQKTTEAKFVKAVDRIATIVQAVEYHKKGNYKKPVEGFWDEKGLSMIKDPELRKLALSYIKSLGKKK